MDNLSAESSTKTENRNFIVLDRSKPISSDVLFLRGDEVLTEAEVHLVCVSLASFKPASVPEVLRMQLEK